MFLRLPIHHNAEAKTNTWLKHLKLGLEIVIIKEVGLRKKLWLNSFFCMGDSLDRGFLAPHKNQATPLHDSRSFSRKLWEQAWHAIELATRQWNSEFVAKNHAPTTKLECEFSLVFAISLPNYAIFSGRDQRLVLSCTATTTIQKIIPTTH